MGCAVVAEWRSNRGAGGPIFGAAPSRCGGTGAEINWAERRRRRWQNSDCRGWRCWGACCWQAAPRRRRYASTLGVGRRLPAALCFRSLSCRWPPRTARAAQFISTTRRKFGCGPQPGCTGGWRRTRRRAGFGWDRGAGAAKRQRARTARRGSLFSRHAEIGNRVRESFTATMGTLPDAAWMTRASVSPPSLQRPQDVWLLRTAAAGSSDFAAVRPPRLFCPCRHRPARGARGRLLFQRLVALLRKGGGCAAPFRRCAPPVFTRAIPKRGRAVRRARHPRQLLEMRQECAPSPAAYICSQRRYG